MSKKKILIVGGTGFLGMNFINKISRMNYEITSISRKIPKKKDKIKGVKYFSRDISKNIQLKGDFDFAINFGGNIDHSNHKKTYETHFLGVKNLINFLKKKNIKRFIHIGSSSEYGKAHSPHDEKMKCEAKLSYGISKLKATNYLLDLYQKNSFPVIILRLYQVYGPGQKTNRLIPFVIKKCIQNKKFDCSHGLQSRDFIYIDDLTNAIKLILRTNKNIYGKIFNVGFGRSKKLKNIINSLTKKLGGGLPLFGKLKMRKDETLNSFPKINLIKSLGWSPKVNLEKGLNKTIFYYKKKYKTL